MGKNNNNKKKLIMFHFYFFSVHCAVCCCFLLLLPPTSKQVSKGIIYVKLCEYVATKNKRKKKENTQQTIGIKA